MLVRVSGPFGWVEQDIPEPIALARIAGGTAFKIEGRKREVTMMNRAVETASQISRKPVGRIAAFLQEHFGLCTD